MFIYTTSLELLKDGSSVLFILLRRSKVPYRRPNKEMPSGILYQIHPKILNLIIAGPVHTIRVNVTDEGLIESAPYEVLKTHKVYGDQI